MTAGTAVRGLTTLALAWWVILVALPRADRAERVSTPDASARRAWQGARRHRGMVADGILLALLAGLLLCGRVYQRLPTLVEG